MDNTLFVFHNVLINLDKNYEQFLRSCHFCWWTYTIFIKEALSLNKCKSKPEKDDFH